MFLKDVMIQFQPYSAPVETAPTSLSAADIENEFAADDSSDDTPDDKDEKIKPDFDFSLLEDKKEDTEEPEEETEELDLKSSKKEDDEETEDKELEIDTENEDELELAKIPTRQQIKAKYPNIFKEFKALDHIMQREKQFAEVFPTISDAKSAKESVKQYNDFQSELLSGNIENVLKAVKVTNSKSFDKIANNLLDTLVRVDPNSHLGITKQVTKGVLNYIHKAAGSALKKNPEDKRAQQLEIASELIHEAIYDTKEVTGLEQQRVEEQENPEIAKLRTERESFEKTRYTAAFNTVSSKMNNLLTNAVARDIDTKNILPPYVKSNVVKDVMSELDRQLLGDTRFRNLVDKLWIKAKESDYNDSSLNNIQTALKEKAKTILPGIMRAKKGEAMKGLTSQTRKKDDERELSRNNNEERRTPQSRERLTSNRRDDDRMKPRQNESNLDFLMRD